MHPLLSLKHTPRTTPPGFQKIFTDKFAKFYIVCFLPHDQIFGQINCESSDDDDCIMGVDSFQDEAANFIEKPQLFEHQFPLDGSPYLSWNSFCRRVAAMEKNCFLIDKLRLMAMETYMTAMQPNHLKKTLFNNYRFRSTTEWSHHEKHEATLLWETVGATRRQFFKDTDEDLFLDDLLTATHFSTRQIKDYMGEASFCTNQKRALQALFPDVQQSCAGTTGCAECPYPLKHILRIADSASLHNGVNHVKAIAETLSKTQLDGDEEGTPATEDTGTPATEDAGNTNPLPNSPAMSPEEAMARAYVQERNLSPSQHTVTIAMLDYLLKLKQHHHKYRRADLFQNMHFLEQIPAPTYLITGEPGAGKSYAIQTIVELVSILQLGITASTSYNGIAAVNVDGSTICSTFSIFDTSESGKHLSEDAVRNLQQQLNAEKLCCLLVDEVSTIDTKLIAILNYRMQQVMGNTLPFGGIPVLFVGDFNQLGPVKKTFIPSSMMMWATRRYHTDIAVKTSTLQNTAGPLSSSKNPFLRTTADQASNTNKPPARTSPSRIAQTFSSIPRNKGNNEKELRN